MEKTELAMPGSYTFHVSRRKITSFRRSLLNWYDNNGRSFLWRNKSASKYELIISEILLQRTRAETVDGFIKEFLKIYPSWQALSVANRKELEKDLQPVGLWKRRAASLKPLAEAISKRRGKFPKTRQDIESLPGVGQYITNAVLLFCHNQPQPLIDVNMARVLERVFGSRKLADIRYDPYLQELALIVVNCKRSKEINWAILDLAAGICMKQNPSCKDCPLKTYCSFNASRT